MCGNALIVTKTDQIIEDCPDCSDCTLPVTNVASTGFSGQTIAYQSQKSRRIAMPVHLNKYGYTLPLAQIFENGVESLIMVKARVRNHRDLQI